MATTFVLQRHNGTQKVYTQALLSSVLARLQAAQQASCAGEDGVTFFNAQSKLLLVDVQWSVGRRLSEGFDVVADPTKPFGLAFQSGSSSLSLDAALAASSYAGQLPVQNLSDVFLLSWDAGLTPPDIPGLVLDAPSPQVPTIAFERDGQLKWTLGTDPQDGFRFQRGPTFQDVLALSPAGACSFSASPLAPTPDAGSNDGKLATTAFVRGEITALVDSAPTTLDTLNELAAALGDDPNFAATTAAQLGLKANIADVYSKAQADALLADKASASDPRLSDPRTPLDGSVTDLKIAGALSQSKVAGLTSSLLALAPLSGAAFSGGISAPSVTIGGQAAVVTTDPRLTDSRPIAAGSVVDASVAAGANIAQSKISGLTTALNSKANLAGATFSEDIAVVKDIAGDTRISLQNGNGSGVCRLNFNGAGGFNSSIRNSAADGMLLRTDSIRPIRFHPNGVETLVLTPGSATFTGAVAAASFSAGGQAVVLANDSRLADQRTPADGSVTDAKVSSSAAIAQSKISGLTTALNAKANLSGAQFSGDVAIVRSDASEVRIALQNGSARSAIYLNNGSNSMITNEGTPNGLALFTLSGRPIRFLPNSHETLVLSSGSATFTGSVAAQSASFTGTVTVGGSAVVVTSDSRLSDARTPTANSVTDASVQDGALSQAKVSGLAQALSSKASLAGNSVFSGTVTAQEGLAVPGWSVYPLPSGPGQTSVDMTTSEMSPGQRFPLSIWAPVDCKVSLKRLGQDVVVDNDARLTNTRVPNDNSVTDEKVADGALSIAKVANLQATLDGKQGAGSIGISVASTSGAHPSPYVDWTLDGSTMWRLRTDAMTKTLHLQLLGGSGLQDALTVNHQTAEVTLSGRLLAPSQPSAFLRFNGEAIVSGGAGSQAKITPGIVSQNVGDIWSAAQGRFNVVTPGLYSASAQLAPQNRSSTNLIVLSLRVNGTTTIAEQQTTYAATVTCTYSLAGGDYVEVFASCPSGATTVHATATSQSYVSFALLR